MTEPYEVIAISRSSRISMLASGEAVTWARMFDSDGEETADVTEAVSAVHELPDGSWVTLDLTEWETVTLH